MTMVSGGIKFLKAAIIDSDFSFYKYEAQPVTETNKTNKIAT